MTDRHEQALSTAIAATAACSLAAASARHGRLSLRLTTFDIITLVPVCRTPARRQPKAASPAQSQVGGQQRSWMVLTMSENPCDSLNDETAEKERAESVDWWKHYDTLRQDKNKTFLAANSFLVAAVGFTLKNNKTGTRSDFVVMLFVAIVGFLACLLWFVLLSRNTLYIEFHRKRVAKAESCMSHNRPGLEKEWNTFTRSKKLPRWAQRSSNDADRALSLVFLWFWVAFMVVSIILLARVGE
jgi:hypothetical protein